jgi:DNA-binding CsgD family transcriptional regulator
MTRPQKWKQPPTHSAADALPMMNDAELAELAADIQANGLQEPIVIWIDNTQAPNGAQKPYPEYLLDGRNRLAALKLLGITDPRSVPLARRGMGQQVRYVTAMVESTAMGANGSNWAPDTDPVTYVLSANVLRRHLTPAQRTERLEAVMKLDPTANNSKIARITGVSEPTVRRHRKHSDNSSNDELSESHIPAERVTQALLATPDLPNTKIAKQVNVDEKTVRNVRRRLEQEGKIAARDTTPRLPKAKPKPKPAARKPEHPDRSNQVRRLTRDLSEFAGQQLQELQALQPGEAPDKALIEYTALLDQAAHQLKAAASRLTETNHPQEIR